MLIEVSLMSGAQTGALNRLFESSLQISKVAHGKYIYSISGNLTINRIIDELKACHLTIDNLTIEGSFTAEDRKLIYNTQKVLFGLEKLMSELE